MNFGVAFKYSVLMIALLCYHVSVAATPSDDDLKRVEKKVFQQSMEHKKLQAQATQISLELSEVSRKMIKAAKQIQNNEDKLSEMEKQLDLLKKGLAIAREGFNTEDEL